MENEREYDQESGSESAWAPLFLCQSFRKPIILSDGVVTTCTLDRNGRNRVGSIHEDDFDTLISRFGTERIDTMAAPLSKPLCHGCFTRLPRWRNQQVPRTGWINDQISEQQKDDYLALFDPQGLSMNVELSSACNLRCIDCSHSDPTFRLTRGKVNIDLDRLMAWMKGHVKRINHIILYHMGETWLHPRWFEFCRFLREENPAITLFTSTNGMLLDSETKLQQVVDSGINHVMFSIHGATQASTETYMGKEFKIDAALKAARRLVQMRGESSAKPYISWKYLLFEWNDSDEEIEAAMRLCDEVGFDEINFSITSNPAPSKRFKLKSPEWKKFCDACAQWDRAAKYQAMNPMTAIYPGRVRRKVSIDWKLTADPAASSKCEHTPLRADSQPAITIIAAPSLETRSAEEIARRGRALLDAGRVLEAVKVLSEVKL